jgi:hypothetical protein
MRAVLVLLAGAAAVLCVAGPAAGMPLRDAALARASIVVSIPLRADGLFAIRDVGVRVTAKSARSLPKVLWLRLVNDDELPDVTVLADVGRGKPKGKTVRFFVRIAVGTDAASPVQRPAGPQAAEIEIGSVEPYRVGRVAGVRRDIAYSWVLGRLEDAPSPVPWASSGYLDLGLGLSATPFDPEAAARSLEEAGWTDEDGDGARDADDVPLYKVETLTAAQAGGENPRVNAISLDGIAVGASGSPNAKRAFVWNTTDGSVTPIDRPAGATSCIAQGISSDGVTVVGTCASGQHAWYWAEGSGLVDLGVGNAYGVSGNVIVGSSNNVAGIWIDRVFTPLPGAASPSAAFAIADSGSHLAGFNGLGAALWEARGPGTYVLARTDAASGVARAWFDVNVLGDAAGTEVRSSTTRVPTVLENGFFGDLVNPAGKLQGEANAISAWSLAGGRFADNLSADTAEIGFVFLNPDEYFAVLDYLLGEPRRISDIGDLGAIAGETTIGGQQVGFVAVPGSGIGWASLARVAAEFAEQGYIEPQTLHVVLQAEALEAVAGLTSGDLRELRSRFEQDRFLEEWARKYGVALVASLAVRNQ